MEKWFWIIGSVFYSGWFIYIGCYNVKHKKTFFKTKKRIIEGKTAIIGGYLLILGGLFWILGWGVPFIVEIPLYCCLIPLSFLLTWLGASISVYGHIELFGFIKIPLPEKYR